MFKELNEFYEVEAKHDERISGARTELTTAREEHRQALQAYQKMVEEDTSGSKLHGAAKLGAAKRAADDAAQVIEIAKERVNRFEDAKNTELKQLTDKVNSGYKREFQTVIENVDAIIEEAKPLARSLLQLAVKAHKQRMNAFEMAKKLSNVERSVGIEHSYFQRYVRDLGDTLTLLDINEINETYLTGELPSWCNVYPNVEKS
ncbi:hypothetical protein P4H42_06865 [Paenibacillus macerans]|uniref:hypothetical protein n=1 Tax=Paenibacillus macerans TaxID=44252 RepID=UPI002DBF42B8|nr:hypothetical protein [Paenibacillus macerans]MEC0329345.1 hypothetical protein [Paenibacillus macerans]